MDILVASSDPAFAAEVRASIRNHAISVDLARDANDAVEQATLLRYDTIIVDLAPHMGALAPLLDRLRRGGVTSPVLALIARATPESRAAALRDGADDCLARPIVMAELAARIHALARRAGRRIGDCLECEDLVLHCSKRSAFRGTDALHLTEREFVALETLLRARGEVVPGRDLLGRIWHEPQPPQPDFLAVVITRLRRKVDVPGRPPLIRTVRGQGYRVGPGR